MTFEYQFADYYISSLFIKSLVYSLQLFLLNLIEIIDKIALLVHNFSQILQKLLYHFILVVLHVPGSHTKCFNLMIKRGRYLAINLVLHVYTFNLHVHYIPVVDILLLCHKCSNGGKHPTQQT